MCKQLATHLACSHMQHWKIHHRLLGCFALVTVLLVALSAYSVYVTRGIDAALSANSSQNAVIQRAAIDFRGSVHDRAIALRDAVLAPNPKDTDQALQEIARLSQVYQHADQHLQQVLAQHAAHIPGDVRQMLQDIQGHASLAVASTQHIAQALQRNDHPQAQALLWTQAKPEYVQWLASINRLIDFEEARIITNNTDAKQAANGFGKAMLLITVLAVAASVAAALLLARNITRELGAEPYQVRQVVQTLRNGELTVHVPVRTGDHSSVMAAVAAMQQRFHELVSAVHTNIGHLHTTGREISAGNLRLGERTEQTSENLTHTHHAMQALTTTVQSSAAAAQQAETLADSALTAADHGGEVMRQVVGTMQDIASSSHRIEEIIGVIDGIAFQTNILALNAAVEAARAGEQGRGFAVVAGEVRALAGRSAEAAQQIKTLIASSVDRVNAGNALVDQAGHAMQDIVSHVQRVHHIISSIGQATQTQSQDILQVHQSVNDLETMTLQNAALVQQSTAAASELQQQAANLSQLACAFTVQPLQSQSIPRLT
jgi:methyl-accepting chemotaxis protein